MPPESRSDKRKERYRELRALGFSASEARRYRDQSGTNIDKRISVEQRRISRKPQQMRSSEEVFRLERIRNRRKSRVTRQPRLDSRRERWQRFSDWSKVQRFPKEYQARIDQINERAGKPRFDGYGYRRFYYEYVERLSMEDSIQLADRGDSGVRYLLNRPLVPGRDNLRVKLSDTKRSGAA